MQHHDTHHTRGCELDAPMVNREMRRWQPMPSHAPSRTVDGSTIATFFKPKEKPAEPPAAGRRHAAAHRRRSKHVDVVQLRPLRRPPAPRVPPMQPLCLPLPHRLLRPRRSVRTGPSDRMPRSSRRQSKNGPRTLVARQSASSLERPKFGTRLCVSSVRWSISRSGRLRNMPLQRMTSGRRLARTPGSARI